MDSFREPLQFCFHPVAELARVFVEFFPFDDFEDFQRDGAGERRAAESRAVRARPQQIRQTARAPRTRRWETAAERFGHRKAVGQKFFAAGNTFENPLKALEFPGRIMAALHAVHEQQQFLLVAQRAQAEQIFRRGGRDAAFALHAFDQNGDGRG